MIIGVVLFVKSWLKMQLRVWTQRPSLYKRHIYTTLEFTIKSSITKLIVPKMEHSVKKYFNYEKEKHSKVSCTTSDILCFLFLRLSTQYQCCIIVFLSNGNMPLLWLKNTCHEGLKELKDWIFLNFLFIISYLKV